MSSRKCIPPRKEEFVLIFTDRASVNCLWCVFSPARWAAKRQRFQSESKNRYFYNPPETEIKSTFLRPSTRRGRAVPPPASESALTLDGAVSRAMGVIGCVHTPCTRVHVPHELEIRQIEPFWLLNYSQAIFLIFCAFLNACWKFVCPLTCTPGPPGQNAGWNWWRSAGEDQAPWSPRCTSGRRGNYWGIRARWGSWRWRFWCCPHIYLRSQTHKGWAQSPPRVYKQTSTFFLCAFFPQKE